MRLIYEPTNYTISHSFTRVTEHVLATNFSAKI